MKKYILVLACATLAQMSFAQGIEWENTIGGSDADGATSVIVLQNNEGYLLGGYSNSTVSGDKTAPPRAAETYDYWLVKLDMSGQITWQTVIGGEGDDYLTDIKQLPDGGFIMVGASISGIYADKTDTCRGDFDYWIVRINAMGDILWQKTYGGSRSDVPVVIKSTLDGGFIVGGASDSDISGDKTENNHSLFPPISIDRDLWVLKLNSAGDIEWQNSIGGTGFDELSDLEPLSDSTFIAAAISYSNISGDKTENNRNGSQDIWIIKLDKFGNPIWDKTIGSNTSEAPNRIRPISNGHFIVSCYTQENAISGDKTVLGKGASDAWILDLDELGHLSRQFVIGGDKDDAFFVVPQLNGNFMLYGSSLSGISGDKQEACHGMTDYWVVQTDANFNIIWQNTIGGSDPDEIVSAALTPNDGHILLGTSLSPASGDKSEDSQGSADFWVVKLNNQPDNTATEDVNNALSSIGISPNPASNQLQIDGAYSSAALYNLTGQLVLNTSGQQVRVADLPQGMYILLCYDAEGKVIHREKVVKQ